VIGSDVATVARVIGLLVTGWQRSGYSIDVLSDPAIVLIPSDFKANVAALSHVGSFVAKNC
jgi:hypothetical protein